MALVEIDMIDAQALQRRVDLLRDLRARQSAVGGTHRKVDLGRQHVGVAWPLRQDFAEKCLRRAAAIDVGGVDEIDPELEGAVDARRGIVARHADAIGQPRSERDFRHAEIAAAELAVFNELPFRSSIKSTRFSTVRDPRAIAKVRHRLRGYLRTDLDNAPIRRHKMSNLPGDGRVLAPRGMSCCAACLGRHCPYRLPRHQLWTNAAIAGEGRHAGSRA